VDDAERYRTLLEINNAVISNLDRDSLFHAIAGALRPMVPFDRMSIFLHDPDRDVLRISVLESSAAAAHILPIGTEVSGTDSHAGWVFRHGEPLVRQDLAEGLRYPVEDRVLAAGFRSYVMLPLAARGKCLGTLGVASVKPNQYGDTDVGFLREVAAQIAMALENMRVHEELARLKARIERENVYLREEIRSEHNFAEMVGSSPALLEVIRNVERVAPTDATVLISGETGTGKELVARAIHARSARAGRALVKVNCGAISAGLVESELFGHVKGAFTGALERRLGRFEVADGGTIFLDEVGELPLDTQVKLLRVLQEGEFEPVGSSRPLRTDVRVIAATNRDLDEAVRAGRFRADLYYRLNVFPIRTPPLRERPEEIPPLVALFMGRFARRFGKTVERVAPGTMDRLVAYGWPGNVRELQNVVERAVVLCAGPVLEVGPELLGTGRAAPAPAAAPAPGEAGRGLDDLLRDVERRHVRAALDQAAWVVEGPRGAARILGLHPNTLRSRIEKLGIRRSETS
jgi:formate hydrogenlyase transcriptional activator